MSDLEQAVETYLSRQDRRTHPGGKFDSAGRWYPSESEMQPCCRGIRSPSRGYPYSYMVHCRTAEHIASLCAVDVKVLKAAIRKARPPKPPTLEGGESYYKAVAIQGDKLLSVFDGETEYIIGQEMVQTAHQNHNGGYYVYPTMQDALDADVPRNSRLLFAPQAIIRVRAEGRYCKYDNGKIAFSRITPLEVVMAERQTEVA